jgi:uncharacterized protein (DUF2252 family)
MKTESVRKEAEHSNGQKTSPVNGAAPCLDSALPAYDKRRAIGKKRRKEVARGSHGTWDVKSRPALADHLRHISRDRLEELVPILFGRMLASPLAFLRGTPLLMAQDLADTPTSGLKVQASGDAHLLNFGIFASLERNLLFDLNDFDETLSGPWEWDLKRLGTSLVLAGRDFRLCTGDCRGAAEIGARSYREHMRRFAKMPLLDVWYSRVDGEAVLQALPDPARHRAKSKLTKAEQNDQPEAVAALTEPCGDGLRICDDPPLTSHREDLLSSDAVQALFERYRDSLQDDRRQLLARYHILDHALKVVGVGSVGTRCYVVLLSAGRDDEPLFLQIKEATPSVLEGIAGPLWSENQGKRIVYGQRLIQASSDLFLGWTSDDRRDYYVRQLRDMKGTLTPGSSTPKDLLHYAELCGWALARAHARSGDAACISGYLGKSPVFDEAIGRFAASYADQTEQDFATFKQAVKAGLVPAETNK